jgi:hypothetical protein
VVDLLLRSMREAFVCLEWWQMLCKEDIFVVGRMNLFSPAFEVSESCQTIFEHVHSLSGPFSTPHWEHWAGFEYKNMSCLVKKLAQIL